MDPVQKAGYRMYLPEQLCKFRVCANGAEAVIKGISVKTDFQCGSGNSAAQNCRDCAGKISKTEETGEKSNLYHHKYINRKKYTKKPDGCFFSILFFRKHDCYNQPKYHNNQRPWHILKRLAHICQNLFYNFTPHKFYYSHGSKKIQVYFFISM